MTTTDHPPSVAPAAAPAQQGDARPRTMRIEEVIRVPESGEPEALTFGPGVTLLVGPPNAGKTKWLNFIDFVLGDTNGPEDTLGDDLAAKYRSATVTLQLVDVPESVADDPERPATPSDPQTASAAAAEAVAGRGADGAGRADDEHREGRPDAGGEEAPEPVLDDAPATPPDGDDGAPASGIRLVVERRWKDANMRSKVVVNGETMSDAAFSDFLLQALGVPRLHFPKGDPYAPRAWPALSWRMLYRHVYREERFWSDLADKQPAGEQHACLAQFLGIAEALFSAEYGALVERRKRVFALQAKKESFTDMLQQVTSEIGQFEELSVAVTADSIAASRARLTAEQAGYGDRRLGLLRDLTARAAAAQAEAESAAAEATRQAIERYGEQLAEHRAREEELAADQARGARRAEELTQYRDTVQNELRRLERAHTAGQALADLRVTHCPVCDQRVHPGGGSAVECYLCHQPYARDEDGPEFGSRRIGFELEQLRGEAAELTELLDRLATEQARVAGALRSTRDEVARLDELLRPVRAAAAAILPPGLSLLDQEAGRVGELLRALQRIERALELRDRLSEEIDAATREAADLEAEVDRVTRSVNFEAAGTTLADGFNSYLNALNAGDPGRWPEGRADVHLNARQAEVTINGAAWRPKLGATFACFFLNAYHYALLRLSGRPGCHYPGVAVLDFPPTLADGKAITDEENYLIEPFVPLVERLRPVETQLIVAGRAFVNLAGARRIELTEVWK